MTSNHPIAARFSADAVREPASRTQAPAKANAGSIREPYALLDAWRCVAALMVVCFHASLVISTNPSRTPGLHRFARFGYLGVEVFFVISGYCIAAAAASTLRRRDGASQFLWRRAKRIYPAYWASLVLLAGAAWVAASLVSRGYFAGSFLARRTVGTQGAPFWMANLSLSQGFFGLSSYNAVSWTLCYEVSFYLIVGIALVARSLLVTPLALLTTLHAVTILTLAALTATGAVPFPLDLWPVFGLGVLSYDVLEHGWNARVSCLAAVIAAQIVVLLMRRSGDIGLMGQPVRLVFIISLLFATLVVLLRRYDGRVARLGPIRALRAIGIISYSLYLTHFCVLGAVNQVFRWFSRSTRWGDAQFIISVCACVLVAWVLFLLFERPFLSDTARRRAARTVPVSHVG